MRLLKNVYTWLGVLYWSTIRSLFVNWASNVSCMLHVIAPLFDIVLYWFIEIWVSGIHRFAFLLDPELDNVETQSVRYKPEGLDSLCRNTNFTRKELQIMYRGFKQVDSIDILLNAIYIIELIATYPQSCSWGTPFICYDSALSDITMNLFCVFLMVSLIINYVKLYLPK